MGSIQYCPGYTGVEEALMKKYLCTVCGGNFIRGRAAVRKSIAAKLSWPFYSDRLFYKPDGESQPSETILREGVSQEAFKCEVCGALMITGKRWYTEPQNS